MDGRSSVETMQSETINGITIEWPEDPQPKCKYTIRWSCSNNAGRERRATFNIVVGNTTKTITIIQAGHLAD